MRTFIFPFVNTLIFGALFFVVGYYLNDVLKWLLIGAGIGLGIGLLVEWVTKALGGWVYRRRVLLAALLEIVLIIAFIGPLAMVLAMTGGRAEAICCIEASGLGDAVEAVRIPVADGETLAGWYAPPAPEKQGAVILVLHGSQANRLGSLPHAQALHEAGYGVLVYDQRALGESTGSRTSFGWYDARDISPIIDYLAARPEVDGKRIGGVGLSLGAYILLAAGPDEPRLRAIWADGLGPNHIDDFPPMRDAGEEFIKFINRQMIWAAAVYLGIDDPARFTDAIPAFAPRSLTLIAGGLDPFETRANDHLQQFLGANGRYWLIENAPHVGGLWTLPEAYRARMIAFFDGALGG
ncbi:MAG: alpha/beta fold hydrolase [Anaerolineae bacterium]|nr:alpha/beta fold hydrolase [Anaerolineae bacterium]